MALSELTYDSVLQAMREYDEVGAEEFITSHGYGRARSYRVTFRGRQYHSKAIAGVAHGYATGHTLTASEFSGGQSTVVKALEALGFAFAPNEGDEVRGWLVTVKSDYRRLGGYSQYDDDPSSHYSYDSNVANSRQVKVGDRLVFWDEKNLIGASTVASIDHWLGPKQMRRCPECGTTNIAARKIKKPKFRCDDCRHVFSTPTVTEVEVTHYRTDHQQGWVDLAGLLDEITLRNFTGYSQNSIRQIDWERFESAIEAAAGPMALSPLSIANEQILAGGHTVRQVRVRIGQPAFRAELVRKHGPVCAFSGPTPVAALEACHLYSYAEVGRHYVEGGLLLRRDLHRLFDQGLLAVTAEGTIDVAASLRPYPIYRDMHGNLLHVALGSRQRDWLSAHWHEWRTAKAVVPERSFSTVPCRQQPRHRE